MFWLWNSMTPKVSDTCMFLTTTKNIWDMVHQTYSKACDVAQIYEIKMKILATKQGSQFVTGYSNILQNLWQEMDHHQCIKMKCSRDATVLKKFFGWEKTYEFLVGLNVEFELVRVQVLGKEELPTLNETIAIIQVEGR